VRIIGFSATSGMGLEGTLDSMGESIRTSLDEVCLVFGFYDLWNVSLNFIPLLQIKNVSLARLTSVVSHVKNKRSEKSRETPRYSVFCGDEGYRS